jgi:beta-glucanase (GH16 family)
MGDIRVSVPDVVWWLIVPIRCDIVAPLLTALTKEHSMTKHYCSNTLRSLLFRLVELCAIAVALNSTCVSAAVGGWQFAWSDEFDRVGTPIVTNVWRWDGGGSMVRNAKLDRASGYCTNGVLVLEAKRVGTNQYTSAALSTVGLKSWFYGRFEMRGRIDIRSGSWPAWWTTGVSGGWPAGGEIDMMEYYSDKLLFNVMNGKKGWADPRLSAAALGGSAWASQFHTWIMEWDSTKIDLSLDGQLVNHYLLTNADGTGPNGTNPFKAPQYMRVNLAIGQQGGDPSATEFPMRFEVDYIRTWQWVDATAYNCTVDGGTGTGPYLPETMISLTANMAPPGKSFDQWVISSGSAVIAAVHNPVATFTMPSSDVKIIATYKPGVAPVPPTP